MSKDPMRTQAQKRLEDPEMKGHRFDGPNL